MVSLSGVAKVVSEGDPQLLSCCLFLVVVGGSVVFVVVVIGVVVVVFVVISSVDALVFWPKLSTSSSSHVVSVVFDVFWPYFLLITLCAMFFAASLSSLFIVASFSFSLFVFCILSMCELIVILISCLSDSCSSLSLVLSDSSWLIGGVRKLNSWFTFLSTGSGRVSQFLLWIRS